ITALVKELNQEGVPCRRTPGRAWSPSTVSRILKSEKYIGRWLWNRTETRRDPRTGRKRRFIKPASEWHVVQREEVRIVPQEVWDRVVARWQEIDRTWPKRRGHRGFEGQQRSYVETHPHTCSRDCSDVAHAAERWDRSVARPAAITAAWALRSVRARTSCSCLVGSSRRESLPRSRSKCRTRRRCTTCLNGSRWR